MASNKSEAIQEALTRGLIDEKQAARMEAEARGLIAPQTIAQAQAPNPQSQSPAEINSVLPEQPKVQQPLPDLTAPQNSPRMGQALLRGALGMSRLAENVLTGNTKLAGQAPSYVESLQPELQNPTGGEKVAETLGNFLDPVALATGVATGKAANIAYEALSPLESRAVKAATEFAKDANIATSNALYKANLVNRATKGAVTEFGQGLGATAVAEVSGGNRDAADVAKKALFGGAIASVIGAGVSGASTIKEGRPKFTKFDNISINETPAIKALNDDLRLSLEEHAKLSPQHGALKDIDEAAQKAAIAEYNHQIEIQQLSQRQSATTDPLLQDQIELNKLDSWKTKEQRLADISSGLNKKLETLELQRTGLLKQIEGKDVEKVSAKLRDLNGKITQLQQAQEQLSFSVKKPTTGSTYDKNQFIKDAQDIALTQVEKVRRSTNIPEAQKPALAKAEWDNALNLQGITLDDSKVTNLGEFFGKQVDFNNMDRKLGVRVGEVWNDVLAGRSAEKNYRNSFSKSVHQLADNLNQLGMTDDQITYTMQYIEQGGFNPAPVQSEKLTRRAFQGPPPSPEAMQQLTAMRQLFDEARQQAIDSGVKVGHIEGYVPLMTKSGTPSGASVAGVVDPRFAQARQAGYLDPTLMETNIRELGKRYGAQVGRAAHLKKPFQQGIQEINKLRLAGRMKEADRFSDSLLRAFNIDDKKAAAQVFGDSIIEPHFDTVQKLADLSDNSQSFMQEVYKESQKLTYESLVASNPATIFKQFLQPHVLGHAELGVANTAASHALAVGPSNPLKQRAEGLLKFTLVDDNVAMQELERQLPKSIIGKTLNAAGIPLKPATALYGKIERVNRLTAIIGGIRKFENAVAKGTVEQALEGLSGTQKAIVQRALDKQGVEAAANAYALIKNNRINFIYDAVNKPEILQSRLGQLLPFTGFARGVVDGMAENVISKNYKQLAKMVAYPLVMLEAVKAISGKEVSGLNPTEAPVSLLTPNLAPQITQPAQKLVKTKSFKEAGKEALKYTPVGAVQRVMKAKSAGEIFGIKDSSKANSYLKQLSKDIK